MSLLSLIVATIVLQVFVIHAKTVVPEAVAYAVSNSFNNSADLVHVVIETEFNKKPLEFLEALNRLLVHNRWSFQLQIDVNNKNGKSASDYNLWFIDSIEAFRRIFSWVENYHRDSQLFFIIVLEFSKTNDVHLLVMEKIFTNFLKLMIANVELLVEDGSGEVSFYTFYPYQEFTCRSAKPFKTFQFHQNSYQNSNVSLFTAKANNLHGCFIRLRTRNTNMLNLEKYEIYYLEIVISTELASRMNFTYEIHKALDNENAMLNENSSGPNQSLKNGEIDLIFGMYSNEANITHFLSKSITYLISHTVIAFRYRPDALHNYVWLLFPFDFWTWIYTLLSIVVISGGIFYVKKNKLLLLNVVQLEHVGLLEVLAVFIGSSVGHLPRKNCLRLVFFVFSFGTLVLRTAYLGKLFDAYRGRVTEKHHRDFEYLLAENYTIYSHGYYASFVSELTEIGNNSFQEIQIKDLSILSHYGNAIFTTFTYIYSLSTEEERRNWIFEIIFGEQFCMFFQQHSIIQTRVNEIIERLEESGILHHLRKNYENVNSVTSLPEQDQRPLGLNRFSVTFYWFCLLNAFAFLVFVAELFWVKLIRIAK